MVSCSTRPTRVQTLVVPTSIPTTISSIVLTLGLLIEWCIQVFHADQRGLDALMSESIHDGLVNILFHRNILGILAEINTTSRAGPASPFRISGRKIIGAPAGTWETERDDGLDHGGVDEGLGVYGSTSGPLPAWAGCRWLRLDQARDLAARCKGNPVGIDPGVLPILVPGQDGCPFHHIHGDVVGEADLYLTPARSGKAVRRSFSIWAGTALKIGWPARSEHWR